MYGWGGIWEGIDARPVAESTGGEGGEYHAAVGPTSAWQVPAWLMLSPRKLERAEIAPGMAE